MYIFYKMDKTAQRRNIAIIENAENKPPEVIRGEIYDVLGNTIFDVLTEGGQTRGGGCHIKWQLATADEIKADRKNMLLSAVSCFFITFLTSVPLMVCLLLIDNPTDSLHGALIIACICLFFIGCKLEPSNLMKYKVRTGASIALIATGLTIFATFFGG